MSSSPYVKYQSVAGTPGAESAHDRDMRERYWRSLRKQAQAHRVKGA